MFLFFFAMPKMANLFIDDSERQRRCCCFEGAQDDPAAAATIAAAGCFVVVSCFSLTLSLSPSLSLIPPPFFVTVLTSFSHTGDLSAALSFQTAPLSLPGSLSLAHLLSIGERILAGYRFEKKKNQVEKSAESVKRWCFFPQCQDSSH